jgi:hypothetical protein
VLYISSFVAGGQGHYRIRVWVIYIHARKDESQQQKRLYMLFCLARCSPMSVAHWTL